MKRWRVSVAALGLMAAGLLLYRGALSTNGRPADTTGAQPSHAHEREQPLRCSHPYVPTRVGTVLEYVWRGQGHDAEITMRLDDAHDADHGTTFVWSIETRSDQGVQRAAVDRTCDEGGAEEPWMGFAIPPGATLAAQTWRIPRTLAEHDHITGSFELQLAEIEITFTRSQEVATTEAVEIAGATYRALRVGIEDATVLAQSPIRSTAWVAPEVGLVRLEVAPGTPGATTYELRAAEIPNE